MMIETRTRPARHLIYGLSPLITPARQPGCTERALAWFGLAVMTRSKLVDACSVLSRNILMTRARMHRSIRTEDGAAP